MPKFSVKKPLTIFVLVVAVVVLGIVSYMKMTPDLLPNMDFPYVMIMTTYPGASPEKVEAEVSRPMEQTMSTLEHIKEVSSTSAENYSMVMLEFEESADLDTIGVDIQQKISVMESGWDEMIAAPFVLKINPSLLPVEVAAVSMEGMSSLELTDFLNETLMNKLEGIPGVARITASGTVEQELHVILDQKKIDALNNKIASTINQQLDDAAKALNDQKAELEKAQEEMETAKEQLESGKEQLGSQTAAGEAELSHQQAQLIATKAELGDQIAQLQSGKMQLQSTLQLLKTLQSGINDLETRMDAIAENLNKLLRLQETADRLQALRDRYQTQIDEIRNRLDQTQEEIDAAIDQIVNSPAYKEMEAAWALLLAELAANGLDIESIQDAIEADRATLEALRQQFEDLEKLLADQNISKDTLDSQIAEMEGNLTQMDQGIIALQDALTQLDSGMIQLKDATAMLSQQKTAGLLELVNASTELALGNAGISTALTQISGGLDTIETSRNDALSKANLKKILTMDQLKAILTAQNFAMPAGYLTQDGIAYMVSVGEEITEAETLENLLLFDMGMEGVEPIYLKDVAMVMVTNNQKDTYSKLNGENSITLNFEKQSTYATAETTNNITQRFRALEKEFPGLQFVALMNQGDYIYLITDSIINSLLLGAIFAVLILFLFLKDWRPTVITLCSIPISVIFAIVLMYFSGVTINMISLSGLAVAVGMLVDNSVVVIENIYRLRSKGANAIQAAVSGAGQVAGAITSSTLTTVCVFLPIVFVEGLTRQLFTDLALTLTFSLMASLIVALTLVPAMASGLLVKEKQHKERLMTRVLSVYGKLLGWSLRYKAVVIIASVVLLIATGVGSLAKGFIFMPTMDMPSINVNVTMPENATMEEAVTYADEVLSRIETVDGIATVGATMSSGGMLGMGGGSGESHNVTIYITLSDETAKGSVVGQQIVDLCADMPCKVTTSSAMMDMSMLSGNGISLQIFAEDMDALQTAAQRAAKVLRNVDGTTEISDGLQEAAPALHISVDRNKAMAKGLTVAQIYMELAGQLTNSTVAATLDLSGTSTDVIIEKPEDAKLDLEKLKNYTFNITKFDGTTATAKLSDFAQVEETSSLNTISRLSQRRYLTVSAKIAPGHNVTLVTSQAQRLMEQADLGEGVSYVFAGENESIMEAMGQMVLMLFLGVLLVYLVMVAQFQSLKSPFIVMFTLPLAFTGGFLGLLICGMELSVISLIGFVLLTGVIVNNGIVLVDYINQLRLEGNACRDAIIEAGKTRMRPILMTSITTILGLMQMAVSQAAGTAMMRPVAVVCIGGLVYATIMTLFVVPCIYEMFNKKPLRNIRQEDLKQLDL